ncbi:MAG: purine biosynthesis protein PurH [Lachnospiraceae bacterium]|nr:purine biosynthesis protein PurH [Lachnospiraceae bacterium]
MAGYLIKDTTREAREQIVAEALGNIEATCDGCSQRVVDMYDAYINGEKELREITMEFSARYVKGDADKEPKTGSCPVR